MTQLPDEYDSLFPYEEAREAQIDGMGTIGKATRNNGIVTMEGACGTGKTLTALVPYLSRVRENSSDYKRVMIVTSVKQQMQAFQDEIIRINDSLPNGVRSVSAITLTSITDLHPFIEQGVVETDKYETIDSLREGARTLVDEDMHDYTYKDLYESAIESNTENRYAYPNSIPSKDGIEYDPYYARYRSSYDPDVDDPRDVVPFDLESVGMLTTTDIREICAMAGLCPHSMMRLAMEHVDVVVGNYMHVFDPKTVDRVSYTVVDEDTLAIFDESHNLVPKVREFLSDSVPLTSITKASEELEEVALLSHLNDMSEEEAKGILNSATQGEATSNLINDNEDLVERIKDVYGDSAAVSKSVQDFMKGRKIAGDVLSEYEISSQFLDSYIDFLSDLSDTVSDQVQQNNPLSEDDTIALRDPENPSRDKISYWTELNKFESYMKRSKMVGESAAMIRNEITGTSQKVKTSANAVGKLLSNWQENDNTRYFRSIEIENRFQSSSYGTKDWQRDLRAELTIHNCIPRDEISDTLDTFGSAVLMSATLEPLSVYRRTTGISKLKKNGREVYECRYGLAFPEENRLTMGVPANKFKYGNRGNAFDTFGPSTDNDTREQYRDVVFDIVTRTPGNVLVVMPSYNEAEWIGSLLEQSYLCDAEDVYIDESSSNQETDVMKNEFFESDDAVLVTGARGTLIEGIDYIGDRLNAAVVCGVPLMNTRTDYKKAVEAAYDGIFSDMDGFTLAFTIPAVWKARQAIGRVIRTESDVGVRALVDRRYVVDDEWDSVHDFLSPSEKNEMAFIPPEDVELRMDAFWDMHED